MKYSIVYSSKTGNTKMLAETICSVLDEKECIYFGTPDEKALDAEIIYAGFWTDKGSCSQEMADFLKQVTSQKVFLFGTAGFGGSQEYFDKILEKAKKNLKNPEAVIGTYMCQGKMPYSVRERYEKLSKMPNMKNLIENFDKALSHPDAEDLERLKSKIR